LVRIQPDPPTSSRGISSAGRAPALQAGGRRFDPVILHHDLEIQRQKAFTLNASVANPMLWIKFDSGPLVCSFLSCCSLKIRRVEIISVAGGKLFLKGDDTVPSATLLIASQNFNFGFIPKGMNSDELKKRHNARSHGLTCCVMLNSP
jgi:hypothetical protein